MKVWNLLQRNYILSKIIVLLLLFQMMNPLLVVDGISSNTSTPFEYSNLDFVGANDERITILPNSLEDSGIINLQTEKIDFDIYKTENYYEGYNIFILAQYNPNSPFNHTNYLIISDMDGNEIKNIDLGHGWNYPVKWVNSTTFYYKDSTTEEIVFYNFYTDETQRIPHFNGALHHDFEYNPISNTFLGLDFIDYTYGEDTYRFDRIVEFDMDGNEIWSFDTHSVVSIDQWCPFHDMYGDVIDITHLNTVFWDIEEDIIYFNARNLNTFYKLDYLTSNIIWSIGEYGDFSLYDISGNSKDILWYHSHSLEKIDEDTFIMFDNDRDNQTDPLNHGSRILEITIDENSMTANESFSWISPTEYYSAWWSDADRLPNNNRVGVFGTYNHPGSDIGAIVTEVTERGDKVWELSYPTTEKFRYGIYRVIRFNFKPTIAQLNNQYFTPGESVVLNWETLYNFRSKHRINGTYSVLLNGTEVDSGVHSFEKYWRKANLTVGLGALDKGLYNFTIILSDESGNSDTNSFLLSITDFHMERQGPESIEIGQENSIIQWTGVTVNPLTYNLSIDGSSEESGIWNEETISYDLNSLSIGSYSFQLRIYNNSDILFDDNFSVNIYPSEAPSIISQPSNQNIIWNESLSLSWELFDHTPFEWEILVNGNSFHSKSWLNESETVFWELPILDEGVYNITLIAYDQLYLLAISITWITIESPSPPIIARIPFSSEILWNQDTTLTWEVHGGISWYVVKNSTFAFSGLKTSKYITINIDNWQSGKWLPRIYNLTLVVEDILGEKVTSTIWLSIKFHIGDAYANEVITSASMYFTNGENALGAPDGNFALIFSDYSNGILTLDMGINEEIRDEIGDDFFVRAGEGEYFVKVGNTLSQPLSLIGTGTGDRSYDLGSIGVPSARYIQIEFRSGALVEVDAIEALHYNFIEVDNEIPLITEINNFWIWENQSSILLEWEVYDLTPWNYSISINNAIIQEEMWDGSLISCEYLVEQAGNISVTLKVFDLLGNYAINTFNIEIREIPTEKSNSYISVIIFALLGISRFYRRRKQNS